MADSLVEPPMKKSRRRPAKASTKPRKRKSKNDSKIATRKLAFLMLTYNMKGLSTLEKRLKVHNFLLGLTHPIDSL